MVSSSQKNTSYEVVYHVFTDGKDEWTTQFGLALLYYRRFKKHYRCARLSMEVYTDRENDEMVYENCLLSVGGFPW